ncbi:hypothetical protein Sango_2072300 [Sesamum angolense]|uniref:Uncharacterized protein n=1 Tax=Sesamum angolense TaxID=2727404 RepID=A0AAE1WB44_9LAMI|nr:hypothetical protein Sango_2072300 [Sesamum angolense]
MNSISPTSPSTQNPNPNPNTSAILDVSRSWEDADSEDDSTEDEEIPSQFSFQQFLGLAEKVIDHGDVESFTILESLRVKWEARFGKAQKATTDETIEGLNMLVKQQGAPDSIDHVEYMAPKSDLGPTALLRVALDVLSIKMQSQRHARDWTSLVCVMLDISSKLTKHIVIMLPKEYGGDVPYRVDIEYEWVLLKCRTCNSLGHQTSQCPTTKPSTKPPIVVFVPRQKVENEGSKADRGRIRASTAPSDSVREQQVPPNTVGDGRGKEVVIYNMFEVLMDNGDGAECFMKSPKQSSPQGSQVRADYASTESQDPMAEGGDQRTRIFFRKVASRRASKRIFQINDDDGQTPTTPREIIGEVVGFYRRLLGGEPSTWFFNLLYLRSWANHTVTVEEAQRLLRPVAKEDIKFAIFDITEEKSLGPDGYSSSFYKAAWPVIGEEVTKAIMEFFSTGCLLRQLNVTLLALIPKVKEQSISLFKRGLEMFASLVGLHVSPTKSHLILSKSAQHNRDMVLGVLGFQEHHLPALYLGFPLISSRLSLSGCKPLLSKIGSRIRGWGGLQLSFAARFQLIKGIVTPYGLTRFIVCSCEASGFGQSMIGRDPVVGVSFFNYFRCYTHGSFIK